MYWQERIEKQQNTLYDKTLEETQRKLASSYRSSLNYVKAEMTDLYMALSLTKDGSAFNIGDLYKFNRYYELLDKLNRELNRLGESEVELYSAQMEKLYDKTSKLLAGEEIFKQMNKTFIPIRDEQVKAAVNSIWCADGKNWSTRVWNNKRELQARLEKGLLDSVSRGIPKDEMVKEIMKSFDVEFNKADRIARTELTYIQGQSAKDTYINAGIEEYKFLAYVDGRTAQECIELNGKQFRLANGVVGVNYPPMHANCRCTIVAVL